jgi:hypothetical protein
VNYCKAVGGCYFSGIAGRSFFSVRTIQLSDRMQLKYRKAENQKLQALKTGRIARLFSSYNRLMADFQTKTC